MRELRVRYKANRRYFPEGKRAKKKPASLLAHTVGSDVDHKRKRTEGRIEFTTQTDSYKVKRVRCNPRVVCLIGSKEGPTISGTAEIVTDQGCCLARVPRQLEDSPANDSFPRMRN